MQYEYDSLSTQDLRLYQNPNQSCIQTRNQTRVNCMEVQSTNHSTSNTYTTYQSFLRTVIAFRHPYVHYQRTFSGLILHYFILLVLQLKVMPRATVTRDTLILKHRGIQDRATQDRCPLDHPDNQGKCRCNVSDIPNKAEQ